MTEEEEPEPMRQSWAVGSETHLLHKASVLQLSAQRGSAASCSHICPTHPFIYTLLHKVGLAREHRWFTCLASMSDTGCSRSQYRVEEFCVDIRKLIS